MIFHMINVFIRAVASFHASILYMLADSVTLAPRAHSLITWRRSVTDTPKKEVEEKEDIEKSTEKIESTSLAYSSYSRLYAN